MIMYYLVYLSLHLYRLTAYSAVFRFITHQMQFYDVLVQSLNRQFKYAGFHITGCPGQPFVPVGQPKVDPCFLYVFTIVLSDNQTTLSSNLSSIVVVRQGNRFSKRMWNPDMYLQQ